MNRNHLVTLNTVGKAIKWFSGAREWEDAVRMFDELGIFRLEKNTESMNLLLDTLCKEGYVEQARAIFLELKSHIWSNAPTFNIFIHGWCKANRVDEALWTLQAMKGYACHPCVISYSTIILFYCRQYNFYKVYELLDEMEAQGCPPNAVTTTITVFLAMSQNFEEALQLAQRMKSAECKPDMTSTYNSMIAMLCHDDQVSKALALLKEMETLPRCKLDGQAFYPLLKACFRIGDMNLLIQLMDDMVKKHQLSLDRSVYALLIHGLCGANKCEWACHLFKEMIGKNIVPKYQTCHLLLEEVKLKNMYDTAEKIEDFMKKL